MNTATANAGEQAPVDGASLYARLGGYDAIATVVHETMPKLIADPHLGRYWAHRGEDGIKREKQLVIDFIVHRAGGALHYAGRDMVTTHKGMKIDAADWHIFITHLTGTLDRLQVPAREKGEVLGFLESLRETMVEQA